MSTAVSARRAEAPAPAAVPAADGTYRDALVAVMHDALAEHDNTLVIGQGVTDHIGIFGTTAGLQARFGRHRVIEAPLAEEAVTGICIGAALAGLYPINTHIRADFGLLAANQIINMAAKYRYIYGGLFAVPMMIRMIIGRSWGQGAQHSQSLQSLFAHCPGLTVLMPSSPQAILTDYPHAIARNQGPVIVLEHRLLYDLSFAGPVAGAAPRQPMRAHVERKGRDVTIVATSLMVLEARRAAEHLKQHGIDCEVIDLNCLSHIDGEVVLRSVRKTGRLLVADTGWQGYGVNAEICRLVAQHDPTMLRAPVIGLGMAPTPCPTAKPLEDAFYPNLGDVCRAVVKLVGAGDIPLPSERSSTEAYKSFRGPF
ncbi:MAG: alpha-ketoacid dehydrogenase subunit beta [Alphaproteobacteria bacterium]